MAKTIKEELMTHIKAKYTVLALQTSEELRAISLIREIAGDTQNLEKTRQVRIGSITKGLYDPENEPETSDPVDPLFLLSAIEKEQTEKPVISTIYIVLDMGFFINSDNGAILRRKIRDMHNSLKSKASTLIFIDPVFEVHGDLQKVVTLFDLPLPEKKDLETILCDRIGKMRDVISTLRSTIKSKPELKEEIEEKIKQLVPFVSAITDQVKAQKDALIAALQGTTALEEDQLISKCIVQKSISVPDILEGKIQIVKKSGSLDYWKSEETQDSIGGLSLLKKWVNSVKNRFSQKASDFGISIPRGVIFVGPPGTGKSLSAKAISNTLNIPLLSLNMAQMSSKWYGETGNRMTKALKLGKAMAPCIILIDEIDKMFGTGGGNEHEESARTRGAMLTAMEEDSGIFWIGTCNQPENLAPELMARFPVIFHVDLPSKEERREIFTIHLKKVKRSPESFDMQKLVEKSDGYVGREIRNAIQEALGDAFDQGTEITTDHILTSLKTITPTSKQRAREIDRIRAWSKNNARPASSQDSEIPDLISEAMRDNLNSDLV